MSYLLFSLSLKLNPKLGLLQDKGIIWTTRTIVWIIWTIWIIWVVWVDRGDLQWVARWLDLEGLWEWDSGQGVLWWWDLCTEVLECHQECNEIWDLQINKVLHPLASTIQIGHQWVLVLKTCRGLVPDKDLQWYLLGLQCLCVWCTKVVDI